MAGKDKGKGRVVRLPGADRGDNTEKTPYSPTYQLAIVEASRPLIERFANRKPGGWLTEDQEDAVLQLLAMNDGHIRRVAEMCGLSQTQVWNIKHAQSAVYLDKREAWKRAAMQESQEVFIEASAQVRAKLPDASARDAAVIAGIFAEKSALFAGDNATTIRHVHTVDQQSLRETQEWLQRLRPVATEDVVDVSFRVKE